MQLRFPFAESRNHDPQDIPCTCGCQAELNQLKYELHVARSYIKLMQERRNKGR